MGAKPRDSVERVRDALAAKTPDVGKVASAPVRATRSVEATSQRAFVAREAQLGMSRGTSSSCAGAPAGL